MWIGRSCTLARPASWRRLRRLPHRFVGAQEFQSVRTAAPNLRRCLASALAHACLALLQVLSRVGASCGRELRAREDRQRTAREAAPAGTGGHWDGPWPRQLPLPVLSAHGTSASALVIPTAECPVVAYRQGAADFCASYGIASAVHAFGDASGAAAIAACAHAALASDDAFGHATICIVRPRSLNVARITCRP